MDNSDAAFKAGFRSALKLVKGELHPCNGCNICPDKEKDYFSPICIRNRCDLSWEELIKRIDGVENINIGGK